MIYLVRFPFSKLKAISVCLCLVSMSFVNAQNIEITIEAESGSLFTNPTQIALVRLNTFDPDTMAVAEPAAELRFSLTPWSNQWLEEADDLPAIESFVLSIFSTYKSSESVTDLENLLDTQSYIAKQQLARSEPELFSRQSSYFRNFSKIRLTGIVSYGEFLILFTQLGRVDGGRVEDAVIGARIVASEIRQSDILGLEMDSFYNLLSFGKLSESLFDYFVAENELLQ